MKRDLEHLKLLSVFYYVYGAFVGLGSSLGLIYVFLGIAMINGTIPTGPRPGAPGTGMPPFMPWFFLLFGAAIVLLGWTLGVCAAVVGHSLSHCKRRMFCCIVAGFCCMNVPLGTALGVCTFLVLFRPRVKDLFDGRIIEPRDPDDEEDDYERPRPRRRARRDDDRDRDEDDRPEPDVAIRPRQDDERFTEK